MRQLPFGKPIIGQEEKDAVLDVLGGSILVHGPRAKALEDDFACFTGAARAVSLSSCTAGLHLVLFDLGVGPGDEVIVPAQTHVATAHAVEFCGAKPVFVDAEPETGNMDLDAAEAAVTPRTRAICVVHFLGRPVDMDRVNALAEPRGLFVLEDCALSVGAFYKGKHTGRLGHAGCFSFYPVKHMTTAEGGMLVTDHQDLADRIVRKRAFGVDRVVGERAEPGVYDVTMLGYNYRMNEMAAALGVEQLKRVPGFLERRAANFTVLAEGLADVDELTVLRSGSEGDYVSSHYCLSAVLAPELRHNRRDIVTALKKRGVGTSVYYPRPVPHMAWYADKYGHDREFSFPVASVISYGSIALPVGPHLDADDMAHLVKSMKQVIRGA